MLTRRPWKRLSGQSISRLSELLHKSCCREAAPQPQRERCPIQSPPASRAAVPRLGEVSTRDSAAAYLPGTPGPSSVRRSEKPRQTRRSTFYRPEVQGYLAAFRRSPDPALALPRVDHDPHRPRVLLRRLADPPIRRTITCVNPAGGLI